MNFLGTSAFLLLFQSAINRVFDSKKYAAGYIEAATEVSIRYQSRLRFKDARTIASAYRENVSIRYQSRLRFKVISASAFILTSGRFNPLSIASSIQRYRKRKGYPANQEVSIRYQSRLRFKEQFSLAVSREMASFQSAINRVFDSKRPHFEAFIFTGLSTHSG